MQSKCMELKSNDGLSTFELRCDGKQASDGEARGVITMEAYPVIDCWGDSAAWSVVLNGLRVNLDGLNRLSELFIAWDSAGESRTVEFEGCDSRVAISVFLKRDDFIVERGKKGFAVLWDGISIPRGEVIFAVDEGCCDVFLAEIRLAIEALF